MYRAFNVVIDDYFYNSVLNKHLDSGLKLYNKHLTDVKDCLKQFIFDNGHIDGSSLKSNWFQVEDVDVFISHSHNDITKVKAYAGWLKDVFGLKAFIDSCAWGYCDDLLKQIDDKYCKKADRKTYNYDLRNYTTSHVHMMLSVALMEMIDRTECIMFYNTPSAVYMADDLDTIKNSKKKVTISPWIYSELSMIMYLRNRAPERILNINESAISHNVFNKRDDINIEYDVGYNIDNMTLLSRNELSIWEAKRTNNLHPLDILYKYIDKKGIFMEKFENT